MDEKELEKKLREVEASIELFRKKLLTAQSLNSVLIDLYNFLENIEADKRLEGEKPLDKVS